MDEAQKDLIQGFRFYEICESRLGSYFLDCLFSDIDALLLFARVHPIIYRLSPVPLQTISVCRLLQRGGRVGLRRCRAGLS